ncbi:hypothetical protein FRB95_004578 [Tulasnella sp. JGI-2019a]|nr:hypothetical protein FRB95_004578 [Tulasnella sp. JGI-2019a]
MYELPCRSDSPPIQVPVSLAGLSSAGLPSASECTEAVAGGSNKNTVSTSVLGAVAGALGLLLLVALGGATYLWRRERNARQHRQPVNLSDDSAILEPYPFDASTPPTEVVEEQPAVRSHDSPGIWRRNRQHRQPMDLTGSANTHTASPPAIAPTQVGQEQQPAVMTAPTRMTQAEQHDSLAAAAVLWQRNRYTRQHRQPVNSSEIPTLAPSTVDAPTQEQRPTVMPALERQPADMSHDLLAGVPAHPPASSMVSGAHIPVTSAYPPAPLMLSRTMGNLPLTPGILARLTASPTVSGTMGSGTHTPDPCLAYTPLPTQKRERR